MNKLLKWLKRPHGLFLALIWIITPKVAAISLLFAVRAEAGGAIEYIGYAVYALSAIFLGYFIYTIVIYAPSVKKRAVELLNSNRLTKELLGSFGLRTVVGATVSLVISIAYSIFNGVVGIVSSSLWYGALSAYYIFIMIIRSSVLVRYKKGRIATEAIKIRKAISYRNCGIMLLLLNATMSVFIAQMIFDGMGFVHYGIMIYVSALYAFVKITTAIINFIKASKHSDHTVRAMRNINMVDAAVSILALQTALLGEFAEAGTDISMANTLTGSAVSLFTLGLGIYMIINGSKDIKRIKTENINER